MTEKQPAPSGRRPKDSAAAYVPDSTDLQVLSAAAAACHGCELYFDATQTVFGTGRPEASLMLVGEQPGDVEDVRGEPFVGPAGAMLNRALADAGIDRQAAYLTNAVKHFHFVQRGKRRLHQTPRVGHVTACQPWLGAEITAIAPELVVALGATAARSLLGPAVRVLRDRGVVFERDGLLGPGRFLVTVHPSSILRAEPGDREAAYAAFVKDLVVAAEVLRRA
jgi:uracil-DNA glycosylase family protein